MRFALISVLVVMLACTGVAFAGVPDAGTSTVEREGQGTPSCNPDTAVVCPASDMGWVHVTVTVRNRYGDPLPGDTVDCWVSLVSGNLCVCPGESPQQGVTDSSGVVEFDFSDMGGCADVEFYAQCKGVLLGPSPTIFIVSPDRNADCFVNAIDFSLFASAYGGSDPCFDYNCDGSVNAVDFSIFAAHYGHACPPSP